MAEEGKDECPVECPTKQSLPFLEVTCKRSGKIRRFAYGTEAGFAVKFTNKKSEIDGDPGILLASYVEAVKEGEVPVIFGPNAPLVDYGPGWKLQTVLDEEGGAKGRSATTRRVHFVEKVLLATD
ncbi:OLC1v1035905C2 [Oldenlandia corymbosa var. corymbosa]|uniref:OLC1v1035905C2 n=1 Tax=Oldenlandia corymbosa var. corymbosa TaxID=529605 RepID=A0AAV1CU48_OLDCO|nr:OLC1v1035905C2 [Oldenlandia corymbosa var. corymbosa]